MRAAARAGARGASQACPLCLLKPCACREISTEAGDGAHQSSKPIGGTEDRGDIQSVPASFEKEASR